MRTSRKDGVLVLKTEKPYTMAVNGSFEQRNTIICKDISNQAESAAFDLEQYFDAAIFEMAEKNTGRKTSKKQNDDDFFDIDCPSDQEIAERAAGLEMIIRSNRSVLLSKLLETFNEIIQAGLVCIDGGDPITAPVWSTVHRDDKLKIVFWYATFFVNPLQRLSLIGAIMDNSIEQGETKNNVTQSEQPSLPLGG